PHTGVDPHPHSERAVLWIVLDGEGAVTVDGRARAVGAGWGALIPAGRERSVTAGHARGRPASGPARRAPGRAPGGRGRRGAGWAAKRRRSVTSWRRSRPWSPSCSAIATSRTSRRSSRTAVPP